jgi:(2R)-phospho-3-sulfolactate synthase (ComA)
LRRVERVRHAGLKPKPELGIQFGAGGADVNLFIDHSQIVQLQCLRPRIWGTKRTWGRIAAYQERASQNGNQARAQRPITSPSAARGSLRASVFQVIRSAYAHKNTPDARVAALEARLELIDRVPPRAPGGQFQGHRHQNELWADVHREHLVHLLDSFDLCCDATYVVDYFTVSALSD